MKEVLRDRTLLGNMAKLALFAGSLMYIRHLHYSHKLHKLQIKQLENNGK